MNYAKYLSRLWALSKRHWFVFAYIALSLLILGPALKPGYIFLLDMPWPTRVQLSDYTQDGIQPAHPLYMLLAVLNAVVPAWLLQKLVLVSVLSAAGSGTYMLARKLYLTAGLKITPYQATVLALYAGVLAILNPFVSERLVAGQWHVLAGYACVPFLLLGFLHWKLQWQFWLMYALMPIISIHFWLIVTLLGLPWLLYCYRSELRSTIHVIPAGAMLFLVINCFWILPLLSGSNRLASSLDTNEFEFFKTIGDSTFGVFGNVIALHGFWLPSQSLKDEHSIWFVYGLVTFVLSLLAFVFVYRHNSSRTLQKQIRALACVIAATTVLATGFGHPATSALLNPLASLPMAAILRETAKFIGILALFVSVGAPLGLHSAIKHSSKAVTTRTMLFAPLVTLIIMSGMLFGHAGALTAVDYPSGWYEARERMPRDASALVLPWQGYLQVNFANGTFMANPAEVFFWQDVIQSRSTGNPMLNDGDPRIVAALNTYLDGPSGNRSAKNMAKQLMKSAGISPDYIVLIKSGNWQRYEQLAHDAGVVFQDDSIILIKLK